MNAEGFERRTELNDVAFGRLLEGQESLKKQMDTLTNKVENIETRLNTGKGFATGAAIGLASLGGGIGAFAHRVMENWK